MWARDLWRCPSSPELPCPVEGIATSSTVSEALLLDTAADLVNTGDGVPHDMEAVDHPCRFRGHDLEPGVVGARHVETAELEVVFDVVGTSFEPAGHLCELPCGKDLDELVVHDIADRGRPALAACWNQGGQTVPRPVPLPSSL